MQNLFPRLLPKKSRRRALAGALYQFTRRFAATYLIKIPILRNGVVFARAELHRQNVQKLRQKEYLAWLEHSVASRSVLEVQKKAVASMPKLPLISIILPVYNTDHRFLKDCIESVLDQSYSNWELCIADDASTDGEVRRIIKDFAARDKRIKYKFRKSNGHICAASNTALELSTGDYIALLDHDDKLWPDALFEVAKQLSANPRSDFIYTDEDKIDESGQLRSDPFFKPDWSPDFLRSINYITHFAVIKKALVDKAGRFRRGYEGAQDWDLFLRVSRLTKEIHHIPKVLYSWRKSDTSTAQDASAKNYAYANQQKALLDDAKARGLRVESMEWGIPYLMWKTRYAIKGRPRVSVIIPTKDAYSHISKCLESIWRKTTYSSYELVVVDTGSSDPRVWRLYEKYSQLIPNLKVIKWSKPFNFSLVCNFGAENATGKYLLFLNNDTEVITPEWIEGLLQYAQQEHVGAVGCKLLYPNHTLQHAGVVLGIGGRGRRPSIAAHLFPAYQDSPPQDWAQNLYAGGVRDFSAVTAACLLVSKTKFHQVNGFEGEFRVAWNDVDFCLKLGEKGWFNVYTPYVALFHHESVSVGKPGSRQRSIRLFHKEIKLFVDKWGLDYINNDPFYSPHFRRDVANARLRAVRR